MSSVHKRTRAPKELVTSGEVLMDIRNLLLLTLPILRRKRAIWKRRSLYIIILLFSSLFVFDYGFGTRPNCDLAVLEGTHVELVKMPPPDWSKHGLVPLPTYWNVPNPTAESVDVFEIELSAHTYPYRRTIIRALAREHDDEAAIDFRDPPLIIEGPTIIRIRPAYMFQQDEPVRKCIIRTYALRLGEKQLPLDTFVDRKTAAGRLVLQTVPAPGWQRFRENVALAFGLIPKAMDKAKATQKPDTTYEYPFTSQH